MRIDGAFGIGANQIRPGGSNAGGLKRQEQAGLEGLILPDDPEVQVLWDKHVQAAAAADEIDSQAVKRARELLSAGQLDRPDAIIRAAEAMFSHGP